MSTTRRRLRPMVGTQPVDADGFHWVQRPGLGRGKDSDMSTIDAALRLAAQLRDDYAWLLAQIEVFGPHWNENVTVSGETTTEGANIMEMARNRFRYQREDHQAAYDAMRALVPPNETGEDR